MGGFHHHTRPPMPPNHDFLHFDGLHCIIGVWVRLPPASFLQPVLMDARCRQLPLKDRLLCNLFFIDSLRYVAAGGSYNFLLGHIFSNPFFCPCSRYINELAKIIAMPRVVVVVAALVVGAGRLIIMHMRCVCVGLGGRHTFSLRGV